MNSNIVISFLIYMAKIYKIVILPTENKKNRRKLILRFFYNTINNTYYPLSYLELP
jgi:hypothetical protein